jgi:hypothetical protein
MRGFAYIFGFLLLVATMPAIAIVMAPLPPVPNSSGSTMTQPITKNSAATQALIDQLFQDATYQKFHDQDANSLSFGDN